MTVTQEQSARLRVFHSLLTTPHRDLGSVWQFHSGAADSDPRFYVRLAAWYCDHGEVRDHKEVFSACLALSEFPGHRDVGLALLGRLPLYEVARVVDFISGRVTKASTRRKPGAGGDGERKPQQVRTGLFRNVPRSMRTEVTRILRDTEREPRAFDRAVLHGRKALKRLYALLHIRPGARAQRILFDDDPPGDSPLFAVKYIAALDDPAEQARLILEHRIPYRVATGLLRRLTPSALVALIDAMSPQEVINHMAALERHGAFADPQVKALVEAKLEDARGARRVSAYKAKEAASAAGVSADLEEKLHEVTQSRIRAQGRIRRPTALLVDKSGSMTQAIQLGKRIGAMISTMMDAPFHVYAFDSIAYSIEVAGTQLTDWEKAFRGIRADGNTSCGVAVEVMRRKRQPVEQIVIVTDEAENTAPTFTEGLGRYCQELEVHTEVTIVKVGQASDLLERQLAAAGIAFSVWPFSGDYYALPNLALLLTRPSQLELLMEILDYPLPVRPAATRTREATPD